MIADFQDWARSRQDRIEAFLQTLLPAAECCSRAFARRHALYCFRWRKASTSLALFCCRRAEQRGEERVTIAAAAVELIHAYSLVHDDLPCMDDDVLRRGKPTCHIEYDEAIALLAGDSLQSLAFQLLAEHTVADIPQMQLEMIKRLAQAAGSRGMAGGQAVDLASVGATLSLPELEFMHIHKTGALIRAAVMLGAYCGSSLKESELMNLDHFAKRIGLAFQVVDDVLDAEASTATLGKTAGKDAENNKPTYVSILGRGQARDLAEGLRRDAYQALEGFGAKADRLRQVTDFIIQREF